MYLSVHQAFNETRTHYQEVIDHQSMANTPLREKIPMRLQDFREETDGIPLSQEQDRPQPVRDRAIGVTKMDSKVFSLQLVQHDMEVTGSKVLLSHEVTRK